jgi:hypothetical protein
MLAGEFSNSTHVELMAITVGQELNKTVETRKPEGTCSKRPRQVSRPTAPVEEKKRKKKRRLRRLSCLDQDVGPSAPVCDEVPAEVLPEVDPNGGVHVEIDPNGCNRAEVEPNGCIRAEVSLIRQNSRCYRGSRGDSDISSPALSALVSLQELSITDFD